MNVYLVTAWVVSDREDRNKSCDDVLGVFDTEEKAQSLVDQLTKSPEFEPSSWAYNPLVTVRSVK